MRAISSRRARSSSAVEPAASWRVSPPFSLPRNRRRHGCKNARISIVHLFPGRAAGDSLFGQGLVYGPATGDAEDTRA
jgi:hypothetical protein